MIKLLEKYSEVAWGFVFLIVIAIFYVSSLQFPPGSGGFGWVTVAYHFLAFFCLAFFLLPALVRGEGAGWVFFGVVLAVLYGVSDEVHQYFVPGRSMAFSDVMVDSAGVFFAGLIYVVILSFRKGSVGSKKKRP